MKAKMFLVAVVLGLTACSTATLYKPMYANSRTHGYQDTKLSDGNYHLLYVGNMEEQQAVVYELFMRRANELAQGKKFEIKNGAFGQFSAPMAWMGRTMPKYEGDVVFVK